MTRAVHIGSFGGKRQEGEVEVEVKVEEEVVVVGGDHGLTGLEGEGDAEEDATVAATAGLGWR